MIRFLNENEWKALLGLGSDMKRHFHVQTDMNGRIELRAWPFFAQAAWSAPGIESKLVVEESVASTSVSSSCIGFISLARANPLGATEFIPWKEGIQQKLHETLLPFYWTPQAQELSGTAKSRVEARSLVLTHLCKQRCQWKQCETMRAPLKNTLLYFYSRKTPTSSSSTESNISWRGKTFQVMDKCQCSKVRRLSLQPIHLKCHAWNLSWCVIAALHPGHANAKHVEL